MTDDYLQDPALMQEFLIESEELLQGMDQDMVALESTPSDADRLNRVFRALHTIKGTSGFLGFEPVVQVSHRAEDVLNLLRKNELQLTPRIMDALLRARDQLGVMLGDIRDSNTTTYDLSELLAELVTVQSAAVVTTVETPKAMAMAAAAGATNLPTLPQPAPLAINQIPASPPALPPLPLEAPAREPVASQTPTAASPARASSVAAVAEVPGKPAADTSMHTLRVDARKLDDLINLIGELVLERNRLMQLSRSFSGNKFDGQKMAEDLSLSTTRLSFITEELQTAGLKTRMVPIETVFRKFPRMVRDVSQALGKEVDLEVNGQDTELDKSMVEMIGDPLVHLVRNSLDHGVERTDVREAAGKSRRGKISLNANQQGDQIIITIADNGAGIDPDRIGRKAVEKGLVTPEHLRTLSKREILDFIFLPGFSTAATVTDISGRGVGMDVVRTNISRLNGVVEIDSNLGEGTTLRLRLPLTVAILPVLLVEVRNEAYALPLRSVQETRQVVRKEIHRIESMEVLQLRDGTLPLLRLSRLLGLPDSEESEGGGQRAVILHVGEKRLALLVDRLLGQESTVVKPLSAYLLRCPGLAGATISGDGHVRLVLDPTGLLKTASMSSAAMKAAVGGTR